MKFRKTQMNRKIEAFSQHFVFNKLQTETEGVLAGATKRVAASQFLSTADKDYNSIFPYISHMQTTPLLTNKASLRLRQLNIFFQFIVFCVTATLGDLTIICF